MELRQLRYLVAVADERHFTRAARRVHVAQPALSQQIRRLESEVGLPLVERTTRRVALTEAGEALVARARRALAEIDAAQAELADLAGIRAGHVRIGATGTLGPIDLSLLLARFHAQHPEIDLTVRERTSDELAALIATDALDFAFLSVTDQLRSGLELHELCEEELVVVLPTDHALAGRARLKLAELRDEDFVCFLEGTRLRELLVEAARQSGFEPHIAFESDQARRIRDLVSRGLGVTVLPRSDVRDEEHLKVVELVNAPRRDVTLAWRAGRQLGPAARAFRDLVLESD
jgi:DNA-binding transcriptional LysR family regulator